jgi:hypothetical protein
MRNGYADYASGFYNIYNYKWFILLVNTALRNAMYKLKTQVVNNLGILFQILLLIFHLTNKPN